MNIQAVLRDRFVPVLADFTDDPVPFADMIRPAQDPRFGDYQSNCAMPLAKRLGANPRELAARIIDKLDLTDLCLPLEIAGPGFINMRLRDDWLARQMSTRIRDERLGVEPVSVPRTVVVDFSSPNVAKPMHVGHLRSTVIGDSLARTLRFLGHQVVTDNHVGDWGTQFGMIIYGFKHFLDPAAYERDAVGELARLYRLVNQLCDYHTAQAEIPRLTAEIEEAAAQLDSDQQGIDLADKQTLAKLKKRRLDLEARREELRSLRKTVAALEADGDRLELARNHLEIVRQSRQETARLHAGDIENVRLWEEFLPKCLHALQRLYDRLEIRFDLTLGESWYNPMLPGVVRELERQGLAVDSDGAKCVFIEGNAAPFIVQKADGAYTYATTDLATIEHRVKELHADEILYVVDSRQSEHFRLLFETARRCGYEQVRLNHVSFGTVLGPDQRPYKTRSGDTVGLESLLDESVAKAREIVAANVDDSTASVMTVERQQQVAEIVGIGGIKYADLQHNRDSDYVFDADKMLAMTGNTATYMQYAFARVQGIFRKGGIDPVQLRSVSDEIRIEAPAERTLALKLCRYPEALAAVASDYRPHLLTQYLFELANDLTAFYDQCPVLKADDAKTRDSRLRLCDLAGRVIRHGLSLLGIGTVEQM